MTDDEHVRDVVRKAWHSQFGPDADESMSFHQLGGDSFAAVLLSEEVEAGLAIEFPIGTLFAEGTFEDVAVACVQRYHEASAAR